MKRIALVLGLISALMLSTSCIKKGGDNSANYTTGDIKVGVYADLSGKTSSFGKSTKDGITMATEEINAAGGIDGRKLVLVVEDDQGVPANAKTVVSKLITSDNVQAVLGEVASTNTLSAAPVAQEKHIPMITPSSTNPKVTQVGDYIFRVCFIDPFQGSVMAKFAANTLKAKKAAILGDVNSDYSKGLTQFFKEEFTKLGGTIVAESTYTQDDNDFKGQLTQIRSASPDVIYIPGYYSQVGIIAKQARELGMNQPLMGGDGWDSPDLFKLGGDALANSYISNHYSVDDPSPAIQKFVAAYKKRFNGEAPDAIAALAYDSAYVLAEAIRKAKTTEPAKLRDAIAATANYSGVTGNITINNERNAIKPAVVLKLDPATKKQVYQETIKP
ncbi:MAG: ABC transporter substrate-binding protein [Pyrinomonadaceae bacterium]